MQTTFKFIDFLLVLPMLTLFLFSLIPVGVKVFLRGNNESKSDTAVGIAVFGVFVSLVLMILFHGRVFYQGTFYAFSQALVFDKFTFFSTILTFGLSLLSLPFLLNHPSIRKSQISEFVFLYLNSLLGMAILIASNDLIITFIGLELMSLSLYMLVLMSREPHHSKEAAIKYFVLGSVASAILLYGISLIYGSVVLLSNGQIITQYSSLVDVASELISTDRVFIVGYALVIIGFAFKISMFPFHSWLPDVYQGAATPLTLFMATAVKVASVVGLARVLMLGALSDSIPLVATIQWLAVLTMLVGNLGALSQTSMKRIFAYSSIAHSGYILVGLLTVGVDNQFFGVSSQALLLYLLGYGLFSVGTFGFLSFLEKNAEDDIQVESLRGFFYRSPWVALGLAFCLLGLAGIPPTLGFFSKFYVFSSAMGQGFYWLVLWALVNSVIGVFYYLKPIVYMFFYTKEEEVYFAENSFQKTIFLSVGFVSLIGGLLLPAFLS
jgi:NADH-quinone oxidoreductase subunit N